MFGDGNVRRYQISGQRPSSGGGPQMAIAELYAEGTEEGSLVLQGVLGCESFLAHVDCREDIEAIRRFNSLEEGVLATLHIGCVASRAASAAGDVVEFRMEMDRAVHDASDAVESLGRHIEAIVAPDGILSSAMAQARESFMDDVRSLLARQADPTKPASLAAVIDSIPRRVEAAFSVAQVRVTDEVRRGMELQTHLISRATDAIQSMDDQHPLMQRMARFEQGLAQMDTRLASAQARASERARGPAIGEDYETMVANEVAAVAAIFGDQIERTGRQDGNGTSARSASRKGDITCTISTDLVAEPVRVVIEAMHRGKKELTVSDVCRELDSAMRNRGARTAIAVVSGADNNLMNNQPIAHFGTGRYGACLMTDGSYGAWPLHMIYRLARHQAIATARGKRSFDREVLRRGIAEINETMGLLADHRAQVESIGKFQIKAVTSLDEFERRLRTTVDRIADQLCG
jgi:hypothetical protein